MVPEWAGSEHCQSLRRQPLPQSYTPAQLSFRVAPAAVNVKRTSVANKVRTTGGRVTQDKAPLQPIHKVPTYDTFLPLPAFNTFQKWSLIHPGVKKIRDNDRMKL